MFDIPTQIKDAFNKLLTRSGVASDKNNLILSGIDAF